MAYVEDTSGEITYETLRAHAVAASSPGSPECVQVAGLADLIAMKRRANRPQDRIDIAALALARGDRA